MKRNSAIQPHLLVECLEEEGVHYIFGIPGEENRHHGSAERFKNRIHHGPS